MDRIQWEISKFRYSDTSFSAISPPKPSVIANYQKDSNHPEIIFEVASELGQGFDWILSYFEEAVAAGEVFQENQLVQMGWMLVMLRGDDKGNLEVWEPQFSSIPIDWVQGGTTTLRHLVLQREVCAQLGVEPDFPSLRQSAVLTPDVLGRQVFNMVREAPQTLNDSGWLLSAPQVEPDTGRLMSLFEIAALCPAIVPFLALPADTAVHLTGSIIDVRFRERQISSSSNVFLARLRTY